MIWDSRWSAGKFIYYFIRYGPVVESILWLICKRPKFFGSPYNWRILFQILSTNLPLNQYVARLLLRFQAKHFQSCKPRYPHWQWIFVLKVFSWSCSFEMTISIWYVENLWNVISSYMLIYLRATFLFLIPLQGLKL